MARTPKGKSGSQTPKATPGRVLTVALDEIGSNLLDDLCETLGVDEQEAVLRALALLSAELAKMAILTPTYFDDDDDDEEE